VTTFPAKMRIWTAPCLLALSTASGLLSGLLRDGLWDALGWCGVGLPMVVVARCLWRRSAKRAEPISSPLSGRHM
jgi:hypothetical protein